jgi:hypothetical protein
VAEFLSGADGWVIASALASDGAVVTQENQNHNKSEDQVLRTLYFLLELGSLRVP